MKLNSYDVIAGLLAIIFVASLFFFNQNPIKLEYNATPWDAAQAIEYAVNMGLFKLAVLGLACTFYIIGRVKDNG